MNPEQRFRIVDLISDSRDADQAAALLHAAFKGKTTDWQDLESARAEVLASLEDGKISRVALDESQAVAGWIGGTPMYDGHVWEIHPLVVSERHRRQGLGRTLVADLERIAAQRGALTLWAGSDDEDAATSLGGADLYTDLPAALRGIQNLKGHPYEFYLKLGFRVAGILPDANGRGKPDIFLAKRITG